MRTVQATGALCCSLLLLVVTACGNGEEERSNGATNIFSPNNSSIDAGNLGDGGGSDGGGPDGGSSNNDLLDGCTDVVCETDFRCVRGACVPNIAPVACEQPIELGELDPATATLTASGDTTDFVDSTQTDCGSIGPFSGAENAFSFTVSSAAVLNLELTTEAAVNWVMEVRRDDCQNTANRVICSDPELAAFAVEPGVTYFLLVEPADGIDKGVFEVEGTFTAGTCVPGSLTCQSETEVAYCFAGEEERIYACSGGCAGDRCAGETCAAALDITESTTLTGNVEAYANDFDFDNEPSCSLDGTDGIAGPGTDFVLRFPNLTTGETVRFDASGDNVDQAFYLVDSCSTAASCDGAADLGDRFQFTAERDGEHFVVVDVASGRRGDFEIEVTLP